jgi:hypothetical protein
VSSGIGLLGDVLQDLVLMLLSFCASIDKSTAVVAFLISLGLPNILLSSVFESINEVATPGETTSTGPLLFAALESHLKSNTVLT